MESATFKTFKTAQDLSKITWGTHPADERGCEALSSRGPHMRTPYIHQRLSEINDLENEPGHAWRLPKVSGAIRDDI